MYEPDRLALRRIRTGLSDNLSGPVSVFPDRLAREDDETHFRRGVVCSMSKPNMKDRVDNQINSNVTYANVADFGQMFLSNVNRLYLLAYLLTGDQEMAERCFVRGLDHCIDARSVFKGWALSWARRAIIKSAIQMISPEPEVSVRVSPYRHKRLRGRRSSCERFD
jgi:hypothetical protein